MLLTAELLLHYQRCDRRAFLDVWGDSSQVEPPSDFHLKLIKDRLAHQQAVLAQDAYHKPDYPKRDWQAGFQATLALMQQGVDRIHQGVLLAEMGQERSSENFPTQNSKLSLMSRPDLLIKQPGESRFGDWLYVPVNVELGKRAKLEYQLIAAFHAQVLAQVQEVKPPTAWLILREKGQFSVKLDIRIPQMQILLEECYQALLQQEAPEVFISRQKCTICRWHNYCYEVAKSENHLSLLPGVSPNRYAVMQELNLTTLESLANADASLLEPDFGGDVAEQLIRQARSVLENRVIVISPELVNLPIAPVELYFDIESQPDLDLAYLLGVLVVDRQAKTEKFYAFLAEDSADEGLIWQQFLDLVSAYPSAPIFHFCDYEVQAVRQMARRYHTPKSLWQPLLSRFVDVHERVCSGVTLPVESYALKSIARWLGFEWRDVKANGAQAICWYDEWLKTSDRTFLEKIICYNEDDCRATFHVKDWLANFVTDSYKVNVS